MSFFEKWHLGNVECHLLFIKWLFPIVKVPLLHTANNAQLNTVTTFYKTDFNSGTKTNELIL